MREILLGPDELIVSKTDLKGRITYANHYFCEVAGYKIGELLGQPHNIIRHPDMPRAVFKLLWDRLAMRQEVFAYVKNLAKNGDFYWVFAHVTPSINVDGEVVGYHSSRRAPEQKIIHEAIEPLYAQLLAEEASHTNRKQGLTSSFARLEDVIYSAAASYDQFVFSLKSA